MKTIETLAAKKELGHGAVRWPRLTVSSGSLEALKWLGLLLMTADHVNKYLFNGSSAALYSSGRLAMPLFVFVLAYNLARPGALEQGVYLRTMTRLAGFGVLVLPALLTLGGPSAAWQPLNILFTLLALAVTIYLLDLRTIGGLVPAFVVFAAAGAFVEFGWPAMSLGIAVWWYCKRAGWMPTALAFASLGCLGFVNGNLWALAALPLIVIAALVDASVPRLRWMFYIYYPLHLLILSVIRIPMSKAGYLFFSAMAFVVATAVPAQNALAQAVEFLPPVSATVVIVFPENSSTFKPNDVETERLAEARTAALVTIRGRTGAGTPTAKDETLALARAIAARNWLVNHGVSPLKIVVNYASAADYAADNSTPEGRRENQRVEVELVYVTAQAQQVEVASAVAPKAQPKPPPSPPVAVAVVAQPSLEVAVGTKPVPATAPAWRERADVALAEYQHAREAELLALIQDQQRLDLSTRETEARLERLRAERAEATAALERRNNEPSPRLYLTRDWAALTGDKTLRGVLTRWSNIEQVPLNWTAPWDYPVMGSKAVRGDLPTALDDLMRSLPAGDARLKVRVDPGKGLTITEEAKP